MGRNRGSKGEEYQKNISREILEKLYWNEEKTITEIAEILGKAYSTIQYWFSRYNIPKRKTVLRRKIPKEELEKLYCKDGRTIDEIAEIYGVHRKTVMKRMRIYGIPSRRKRVTIAKEELERLYWEEKESTVSIARKYGASHNTILRLMRKYGIPTRSRKRHNLNLTREQLYDLYWNKRMSTQDIAERFKVGRHVISRLMDKHGIPRRKDTEASKEKTILKVDLSPTPALGYIVGAILGDGCVSMDTKRRKHRVILAVVNKKFAKAFYKCLVKINANPFMHIREVKYKSKIIHVSCVQAHSRMLCEVLNKFKSKPQYILKYFKNKRSLIAILRGFYDSEGYITARKNGRLEIGISNTNKEYITVISQILLKLGIYHRIHGPYGSSKVRNIRICKQDYAKQFLKIVKPTIKRRPGEGSKSRRFSKPLPCI